MNYKILSANSLKLIAILAMTVDHLAAALWTANGANVTLVVMRVFGRLTMPIMCFCVAEGYRYTRNWRKYLARLLVFAFIAHFAYIYLFNYQDWLSFIPFAHGKWRAQTSVLWGLACGLLLVRVYDTSWKLMWKLLVTVLVIIMALPADWLFVTPLMILGFWKFRDRLVHQIGWMCGVMGIFIFWELAIQHAIFAMINLMVILSIPVLWLYNGQRGKSARLNRFLKWFFYVYYPLHLFILGVLLHCGVLNF